MVPLIELESITHALQVRCATNCATAANRGYRRFTTDFISLELKNFIESTVAGINLVNFSILKIYFLRDLRYAQPTRILFSAPTDTASLFDQQAGT